jgi:hypothetical protein
MANISLTITEVLEDYTSEKGNVGTLIRFDKLQASGKHKGKAVCKWLPGDRRRVSTREGWEFDDETGRVIAPFNTEDQAEETQIERQAKFAGKYNARMQFS